MPKCRGPPRVNPVVVQDSAQPGSSDNDDSLFARFKHQAETLGLKGKDLVEYVERQTQAEREREQAREQAEREQAREQAERELAREREERELTRDREEREYNLEMYRIQSQQNLADTPVGPGPGSNPGAKVKLPFLEDKDDIEAYLIQFERVAHINGWKEEEWGARLAPLLKGKARDTFVQLPVQESTEYPSIKKALLRRSQLNATAYRQKFCEARRERDEESYVFWDRLVRYLDRWIALSDKTVDDLHEMLVLERFLEAQNPEEARFIRERNATNREQVVKAAELFEETRLAERKSRDSRSANPGRLRDRSFHGSQHYRQNLPVIRPRNGPYTAQSQPEAPRRTPPGNQPPYKENKVRFEQRSMSGCYKCGGPHRIRDCPKNKSLEQAAVVTSVIAPAVVQSNTVLCERCDQIPFNPHCVAIVEGRETTALRDTGATTTVVSKSVVPERCYTKKTKTVTLASQDVQRELPIAIVNLETPYFSGETEVVVMDAPVVPVLIGNIRTHPEGEDSVKVYPKTSTETAITAVRETTNNKPSKPANSQYSPLSNVTPEQLKEEQARDPTLQRFLKQASEGDKGVDRKAGVKSYYYMKRGILYRRVRTGNKEHNQVIVPACYRQEVLRVAHDMPMAGHLGTKRTKERIWTSFYWPGFDTSIKNYCLSCDACQRCAAKGTVKKAPLQSVPLVDVPFRKVAVDLIGPVNPVSEQGNKYILTMIDYATKYVEATPLKTIDSIHVAEALLEMWSRLGIPEEIVSDRGSQFVSEIMKEVHRLLSIKGSTTTPYHAQANGLVERFNGTLKSMIKKLCLEQPKQWDRYMPALLFAYRETPQESTKFSPFELLYGRTVRGPMQVLKKCWTEEEIDPQVRTTAEYVTDLRNRMEETCELAREHLQKAKVRQAAYFNRRTKDRSLNTEDKVLVLLPEKQNKLRLTWRGPYPVEKKINAVDYLINIDGKQRVYHINLLKRYHERQPEEREHIAVVIQEERDTELQTEGIPLIPLKETEDYRDIDMAKSLTKQQKKDLNRLVNEHKPVFTDLPGDTHLAECKVNLLTKEPVRVQQYPLAHSQTETIKKEVQQMLDMDVIERASSPYNAPIVLVKKKDGAVRFCIDYRKLNAVTEFDAEPLPDIEGIFSKLNKAKYFSKIDLSKGFWQIPMRSEDKAKTAFSTPEGQFQWKRMPFGMKNASAIFSRMMRNLLSGIDSENIHNFMDDILIATETWSEHMKCLENILKRLREAGLTARPSKCHLGHTEMAFLGHQVGNGEIWPEEDKVERIKEAKAPKTKKELRAFLGLAGYYRKFVHNFAEIATPLTDATKKGKPELVSWTPECETAFGTLKTGLTSKPIIMLPDRSKEYTLRTDASDKGLGAVLLQEHEGDLRPVAYASKKLNSAETNYSTIEKECLGIVWGIKKFEPYLFGNHFVLETDHRPLQYLQKSKTDNGRLMRWALQLQQHSFTLRVIPGVDNVGADYLSRLQ